MLRRFLLLAAWSLAAAPVTAEELPAAPEGYRWKQVESVKAAFLIPEGWFFKEEENKGTHAFFISKESIAKGGDFATGLSVNVVKLKKDPVLERAKTVIAQYAQLGEVQKLWEEENGALQLYGARIHVTRDPPAFTEHLLAIGNTRTNTLYIVLFESPDESWDEAWKKGEVMLGNFLLDDEF